ncbi:hypothetical protein CSB45_02405 [candidate division KSB3 bacterium]|uniref:Organic solvent tolerance-like N-terminal domain-containing protein n=1 Tax=candidate division KSB3 bacterium TaxID=2044937 RepID=A0A2G6EAS8_9BACT|nr:MAG: hypothetical protein CSB45_02405 [candidate division KSB3 bacterium]PIE30932.1 MAG: hypothetical protein CSA57_01015 [candidate division KSB3 bacterium]
MKTKTWKIILSVIIVQLCCAALSVYSEEGKSAQQQRHSKFMEQHKRAHEKRMIEKKASVKSSTQPGRTSYSVTIVDSYEDCAGLEDLGNIRANGSVRNIYHVTRVTDPRIRASKCPLLIGNIDVQDGNVREIATYTEIRGSILSRSQDVMLGNIRLKNAEVEQIRNVVEIGGSIEIK